MPRRDKLRIDLRLVENAHDARLAEDRRDRRDADVDRAVVDVRRELAVLRPALFDDVHVRHDLDAIDEPDAHCRRQRQHVFHDAVDAVADAHPIFLWLEVDIRSAVAEGLGEDAVHDPARPARRRRSSRLQAPRGRDGVPFRSSRRPRRGTRRLRARRSWRRSPGGRRSVARASCGCACASSRRAAAGDRHSARRRRRKDRRRSG